MSDDTLSDDTWPGNWTPYYVMDDEGDVHPALNLTRKQWLDAMQNRAVAADKVEPGVWVSTIFRGIAHNFDDSPPLVFETMVFKAGREDQCAGYYATRAEALKGHAATVELLRRLIRQKSGQGPDRQV